MTPTSFIIHLNPSSLLQVQIQDLPLPAHLPSMMPRAAANTNTTTKNTVKETTCRTRKPACVHPHTTLQASEPTPNRLACDTSTSLRLPRRAHVMGGKPGLMRGPLEPQNRPSPAAAHHLTNEKVREPSRGSSRGVHGGPAISQSTIDAASIPMMLIIVLPLCICRCNHWRCRSDMSLTVDCTSKSRTS